MQSIYINTSLKNIYAQCTVTSETVYKLNEGQEEQWQNAEENMNREGQIPESSILGYLATLQVSHCDKTG